MKTYEITIKPQSGFGTPLKGDTIFGHLCWQAAYDDSLFGMSLDALLDSYVTNPFLIVSSAYPKFYENNKPVYVFKRPELPLEYLFDLSGMDRKKLIRQRKDYKAKKWMLIHDSQKGGSLKELDYICDKELFDKTVIADMQNEARKKGVTSFVAEFSQSHNTINRMTGTTGEGRFTPFAVDQKVYFPQTELSIFVGADDKITSEQVEKAFRQIGEFGFGKDASTGLGKFDVCDVDEVNLKSLGNTEPNACYTLSPCVPEKNTFSEMFFTPFTRFGRHGDVLAKSGNPFKNPVIMADEGAMFKPKSKETFGKPYIGSAVSGISKSEPKAVTQGYSLYIPVKVEV